MLRQGFRLPCGGKACSSAAVRLNNNSSATTYRSLAYPVSSRAFRSTVAMAAPALNHSLPQETTLADSPRVSALRMTAEAGVESATAVITCRFIVPYYVTKPGQQLYLSGCTPELGGWDADLAVPLEWKEGHQHATVVRMPSSRVVQVKLVLKENGQPVIEEEGTARDILLMPVNDSSSAAHAPAESAAADPAAASRLDYQIMCHFGNTEATQILRLPVILPAKEQGDRRVLCKFVVMLDHLKLEPRHYPVVVGSAKELGDWKAEEGVKLIRQVGGYWTRRVELPLNDDIHAKVVICNPDGQPVLWEPGTNNRNLSVSRDILSSSMHVFVCRWSMPEHTPVVSVPVEFESANKEYVKQLDAAQREIGVMRKAVTAKSRQCQSLESELTASRRAERALREEVSGLRSEIGYLMQDVEMAQRGELGARQEAVSIHEELQQLGENYERQISFLESKLDEMEQEMLLLQERLATTGSGHVNGHGNSNGNGNGHASGGHEASRVISRSSWR